MSDASLPGTPGTGDVPEPEPEGFREEQIEKEKERLAKEEADQVKRNKEQKDFYSGKVEPTEPAPKAPTKSSTKSTKDTSSS